VVLKTNAKLESKVLITQDLFHQFVCLVVISGAVKIQFTPKIGA